MSDPGAIVEQNVKTLLQWLVFVCFHPGLYLSSAPHPQQHPAWPCMPPRSENRRVNHGINGNYGGEQREQQVQLH